MTASVVIFDIGGVLVDWQPHLAFVPALGSDAAARAFLERTNFFERNLRGDNGERFADMALELDDAADQALFATYVENYALTIEKLISGTWEILNRLKTEGVPVHGITNWSSETWPVGVERHPELGQAFETLIVSGEEALIKPDARIFNLLCERAGVTPADCVFIDDSVINVEGARAAGMDAIHFTNPPALESALMQRGLL